MEGNQVGSVNQLAASDDELQLLWPHKLMAEIAAEKRSHVWSTPLALVNFIVISIIAFLLGPLQLILLILTQNYVMVTESYAPIMTRIALIVSGLLAISTIVAMFRTWKEQPRRSLMTAVLGISTMAVGLVIWIAGTLVQLAPAQIAFLLLLVTAAGWVLAIVTAKQYYVADRPNRALLGLLIVGTILGGLETIFAGVYIFNQTDAVRQKQGVLEELGQAQAAAAIDGITTRLSDLVFSICDGAYDAVYIPPYRNDTGLFECRESKEVYSVSGPNEPVSDTAKVSIGSAFYFGKTFDATVSTYFPPETGVKYLYRDLGAVEVPSELVMLIAAASEDDAVNSYLDQFVDFLNARTTNNPLLLSIFYNAETNSVVNTKDFILIAAADAIALTDYLPRGTNYRGYLNNNYGTYIFTPDLKLPALKELGLSPLLYSSQTRDAINTNRHITVELAPNHEFNTDELREIFYGHFLDPVTE